MYGHSIADRLSPIVVKSQNESVMARADDTLTRMLWYIIADNPIGRML
jgi:hypothetical protein